MPISHGRPLQKPQPVPATSQACHASTLFRSPNSLTPPPGDLGRMSSYSPPPSISWPLEEAVNLWSQLGWSFQVEIQESLFIFFRCWTPPGRGKDLLQPHWAAPPVLFLRFLSAVIQASGVATGLRQAPGHRLTQPLYFFLQGGCSTQGPLVGFPCLSEAPFYRGVPPSPPGGFAPWRPDIHWTSFLHHPWWFTPSAPGSLLGRTPPLQ